MQSHLTDALLKTVLPLVCQTAAFQQVILALLINGIYNAIMQEQQLIEQQCPNLMEMALREVGKLTDGI